MTRTCEGHDNGPIVLGLRWAPGRSECLMTPNQQGKEEVAVQLGVMDLSENGETEVAST